MEILELFNLTESSKAIPQPSILGIELMEHQKRSIRAMIDLETRGEIIVKDFLYYDNKKNDITLNVNVGILGDRVGAGKSLMIVTLILLSPIPPERPMYHTSGRYITIRQTVNTNKRKPQTLVIVPNKLIEQWKDFFSKAPKLKIYVIDTAKSIETIDETSNVYLISNTIFDEFQKTYENNIWGRIIVDEADSIKMSDTLLLANFIWLVTGTPSGISCAKKKYIRNIFETNKDWLTDMITIKNDKTYLEQSIKLPTPKRIIINCYTPPEIKLIREYIPNHILQMINAGNSDDAIKALNCHVDTEENIFQVIIKNITNTIHNKKLELETENKKIMTTNHFESQMKVKKIEKSIKNLEIKLTVIKNKFKDVKDDSCMICLDDVTKPTMLDCCATTYCFECITLTTSKSAKCPHCQKIIEKKNMHVIKKKGDTYDIKPVPKLKQKIDILLEIIKRASNGKILVFANFSETFKKIVVHLESNSISYGILKGTQKVIHKMITEFENGSKKVIMLNAANFGAGMNLQMATDVVIYHRFTSEMEEQVIGRAQRLGRTTPLNVHYLIHANETDSFSSNDQFTDVDYATFIENSIDIIPEPYIKPDEKPKKVIKKKIFQANKLGINKN